MDRRHLNASQLGMIGARMANLSIGNPNMNRKSAIAVNTAIGVSQDQAANILGVSWARVRWFRASTIYFCATATLSARCKPYRFLLLAQ